MKQEFVPHVDKNDNQLGIVDRTTVYQEGLIHRGVHAFIQNKEGLYLVQQRSNQKPTWPGYYDLSVAETLRPEEAYSAALARGLQEELNLTVSFSSFQLVKEKYYQEYCWGDCKVFGIICLFSIFCSKKPHFLDGEVQSIQWLTEEEISSLILEHAKNCTPWFINDWKTYLQLK